jgi:hypothetical protein
VTTWGHLVGGYCRITCPGSSNWPKSSGISHVTNRRTGVLHGPSVAACFCDCLRLVSSLVFLGNLRICSPSFGVALAKLTLYPVSVVLVLASY